MRVRWTIPVAANLYNIVRHIQQDNPQAAADAAESLYDGCASLRKFPHHTRGSKARELVFCDLPSIVVYRVGDQIVEVMRIYHGAQDWP
jgi:toxin ParE1/3/4